MALPPALTRTPYVLWDAHPRFNVSAMASSIGLVTGGDTGDIISWTYESPQNFRTKNAIKNSTHFDQNKFNFSHISSHIDINLTHPLHKDFFQQNEISQISPPPIDTQCLTPSIFTISQSGCAIVSIISVVTHSGTHIKYDKSSTKTTTFDIAFQSPSSHYIALHADGTIRVHTPSSSESYTIAQQQS
jgi:hypothetical protein